MALNTIAIPPADINVPNIVANIKSLVIFIGIKVCISHIDTDNKTLEYIVLAPNLAPKTINAITNKTASIIKTNGPIDIKGI